MIFNLMAAQNLVAQHYERNFDMIFSLRGSTPFFLPILVIIIIVLGEKVYSGIWKTCPKILGEYEY